jgi:hypothetical protein
LILRGFAARSEPTWGRPSENRRNSDAEETLKNSKNGHDLAKLEDVA